MKLTDHIDFNLRKLLSNIYGVRLKKSRSFKKYRKKFYANCLADAVIKLHAEGHWRFSKRIRL